MFAALQPGDLVDVIAPGFKCSRAEFRAGVRFVESLGLRVRIPKDLFGPDPLFSQPDPIRAKHLRRAIYSNDSKVIWCARGGYGSFRLIPEMEKWPRPKHAKILLGFSDVTSLHEFVRQKWGWSSLHGPHFVEVGSKDFSATERKQVQRVLFGEWPVLHFTNLKPLNSRARRGIVRAPVVGGSLTVLAASLGTKRPFKATSNIAFFEDIGERPHRIDRMLEQMRQAGVFEGVRAIVFGQFLCANAADQRLIWSDVIPRFAHAMKAAVLKGLPVGHSPVRQNIMPLNTRAELRLGRRGTLSIASGIVTR